jgi:hypothetical protein
MGTNTMRSILALGLIIITSCASADAATAHRFKPLKSHARPAEPVAATKSFAVPGWTEEETLKWLHNGSAGSGKF